MSDIKYIIQIIHDLHEQNSKLREKELRQTIERLESENEKLKNENRRLKEIDNESDSDSSSESGYLADSDEEDEPWDELPEWKSVEFYERFGKTQPSQLKTFLKGLDDPLSHPDFIWDWIHTNYSKTDKDGKYLPSYRNLIKDKISTLIRFQYKYVDQLEDRVLKLYQETKNKIKVEKSTLKGDRIKDVLEQMNKRFEDTKIDEYTMFACYLPPRRIEDIHLLMVTQEQKDFDEYPNQYIVSEHKIVFNKFKNSSRKGTEVFTIDKECFPFVSDEKLHAVRDFMEEFVKDFKEGSYLFRARGKCSQQNFRKDYIKKTGFQVGQWRHFWETKIDIDRNSGLREKKALLDWFSHNMDVAMTSYQMNRSDIPDVIYHILQNSGKVPDEKKN